MKKLFISMFVAVVAFTLWSCGPANTPSAVAEEACKCVQNEDYPKIRKQSQWQSQLQ